MKSPNNRFIKYVAALLVVVISIPMTQTTAFAQTPAADKTQQNVKPGSNSSEGTETQDHEPAATLAESALPDNPSPSVQQESAPDAQSSSSQTAPAQQENNGPKPVGTAAAPYEKPAGGAASRPAGAVIAPAKQRRVRTILISLGVVIGAGVAIGTVAGLSKASPSRPN